MQIRSGLYLDVLQQGVTLFLGLLVSPLAARQSEATQLLHQNLHIPEARLTQSPSNRLHPGPGTPP